MTYAVQAEEDTQGPWLVEISSYGMARAITTPRSVMVEVRVRFGVLRGNNVRIVKLTSDRGGLS